MSNIESFDDFYSTENNATALELSPFQFREDKSKKATLEWLFQCYDNMEKNGLSRFITYRRYQALYKGLHWRNYDTRDVNRETSSSQRKPRMVTNFVHEMVEAKVAQMARLRSSIALIPNNNEQSDINNAKACKMLLDARAYDLHIEEVYQKADRIKYIFGHSFKFVEWDKDAGPISPAYKKVQGGKDAKKKLKELGGEPIHIGDVTVTPLGPDRVFAELGKETWEEKDYIIKLEWVHIEALKVMYPKHKSEIMENRRNLYDYETSELTRPIDMVMVRTFYHRKTKYFPEGAIIKHTDDVILEWNDFHYEHGELPCVPDTDIDIYGEFWGRSFITLIEQMQRMHNNIQSGIARDYSIGSAPKWMVPKGACDFHDLNNEFTIVEYSGPQAPVLVESRPTSNQAFEVQDRLEKYMSKSSSVYDVSRGEVPTGVTANSALRFLDEQESQRIVVQERKRKTTVIKVSKLMLSTMAQYYKASDGRTVRILGEKNQIVIEDMKKADFGKIYDVRIQNSPALPDSKAGKIAAIVDLNTATQTDPIFRREHVVDMLDLGMDEAYKDMATAAVDAARTTMEMMLQGKEVPEPKVYDSLLVHYDIFVKEMQEFTFKTKVSEEIQAQFEKRVKTLEGLMYNKSLKNPKFAQELMMVSTFPIYFTLPMQAPLAPDAIDNIDTDTMKTDKAKQADKNLEQTEAL